MQTFLSFHGSPSNSFIHHLLLSLVYTPPSLISLLATKPMDYWDTDTPEQCRERRHRRIQMRRSRWCCCGQHFHPQLSSYRTDYTMMTTHEIPQHNEDEDADRHRNPIPNFGKFSLIRRHSESIDIDDTLFVKKDFCRLELLGGEPMHFFAVFDAHGDPHVSTLCKQLMHQFVAEELRRVCTTPGLGENLSLALEMGSEEQQEGEETKWHDLVRTALERSFQRMNRLRQHTCSCGNITDDCSCGLMILTPPVAAVVAILTAGNIVIANSGTSRAAVGRAGSSLSLLDGSKPERLDAQEMLRAVDGRVSHHNGMRVYGVLNMSQSPVQPGDHDLLNISITERDGTGDECLILANNGIWDAISDDMACTVAKTCLTFEDGEAARAPGNNDRLCDLDTCDDETNMFFSSKTNSAAAILCRLALGRGSRGDISVIVVDLLVRSK